MTWGRWLLGVAVLLTATVPPFVGAAMLRRRLLPRWPRLPSLVADAVVGTTAVVLLAELLGTFGLLRPVPLAIGGVAAGGALLLVARRGDPVASRDVESGWGFGGRPEVVMAVLGLTGLAAQAFNAVAERARHGILDPDSLHYHLTFAATFAKTASTTSIAYVSPGDGAPYHPASGELLHGLGLVAFRVEVLTLALNLAGLALAVLAAAAIGARVGRGALGALAATAILATPMLGREQAGSPANDVLAIAFLLSALALVVWSHGNEEEPAGLGFVAAGLAAGLAVGTKLTTAVPAALVVAAAIAAAPSVRAAVARGLRLVPAAALAGGYWPARNLVHAGSPYPALELVVFPRPPMPVLDRIDQSVVHYLRDRDIVREVFVPGIRYALGPGRYALLLVVAAAGIALLVRGEGRLSRLLGVAGGLSAAVYLVTPTTAGGPEGDPFLFRFNVRYLGPALCLVAVASLLSALVQRFAIWWAAAWLALVVVTLSADGSWAEPSLRRLPVVGALLLAAGAMAAVRVVPLLPRPAVVGAAAAVLTVAVLGGGVVADRYVGDRRYAHPNRDRDRLVAVGRTIDGGRTGVSGFPLTYSFFGPELEGEARYVAEVTADDEVRDPPTCLAWRAALRDGRFDRVAVLPFAGQPVPPTHAWTASIPGVRTILSNTAGTVFTLPGDVTDEGC